MNDLVINSVHTVTPAPYAEIFCIFGGESRQYRVFSNGYIVIGRYCQGEDSKFNWYFHKFDSSEPHYEEIQKVGLQILNN